MSLNDERRTAGMPDHWASQLHPEGTEFRRIQIRDEVYYTEETLYKVYGALRKDNSLTEEQATDAIMRMQNAGILFRECIPPLIKPKTIITRGGS